MHLAASGVHWSSEQLWLVGQTASVKGKWAFGARWSPLQPLNFAEKSAEDNMQMSTHGCVPHILIYKQAMGHSLPIHGLEHRGHSVQRDPLSDLLQDN